MRDILHTKHEGCGGTFEEINIWEDIECTKCGEPSERYVDLTDEDIKGQEIAKAKHERIMRGFDKPTKKYDEVVERLADELYHSHMSGAMMPTYNGAELVMWMFDVEYRTLDDDVRAEFDKKFEKSA